MEDDAARDERIWALVRDAGVRILWPAHLPGTTLRTSAVTTSADSRRILSALAVTVAAGPAPPTRIELMTFVRERILATRRGSADEEVASVGEYLEREARRTLALRSLEVGEGEVERGGAPIGQLTLEREALLPPATDGRLSIDDAGHAAKVVAYGPWSATWADLPDFRTAVIVYVNGPCPALVTRWPPKPPEG